jgi:hypothetical protein
MKFYQKSYNISLNKLLELILDLTISTWMMLFFILFLIVGMWKVYVFLPTKQLADDDKTQEAHNELIRLMIKVINEKEGKLNNQELFLAIQEDDDFDSKLFWRFNHNRLNQLLNHYYTENPRLNTIKNIYKQLKDIN